MGKQNTIQTAFSKGEVSPLARGRVDVNLYSMGAKTIENLIVRPQGPAFRRSGTKFVRSSKFGTSAVRIVPFTVSDTVAYQLEFGAGYIHFYKNKEPLFETTTTEIESYTIENNGSGMARIVVSVSDLPGWGNIPGTDNGEATITAGAGGKCRVTTTVPHTLRTGVQVVMLTTPNTNSLDGLAFTITRISAYAFDLDSSVYAGDQGTGDDVGFLSHGLLAGDRVFFSGGAENAVLTEQFHTVGVVDSTLKFTLANVTFASITDTTPSGEECHCIPIEVVTDFTEADLPYIRFAQSADVLYIFHPDYPTQKLVRLDTDGDRNDWLLADINFTDGPYLPLNSLAPNIDTTTPANGAIYEDVYFEISSYAHTANVTAATNFAGGSADQNKYLEYRVGDEWRLAQLTSASSGVATGTVSIIDNIMLYLDEATRLKKVKDRPTGPASAVNSMPTYRTYKEGAAATDPRNAVASDKSTGGGAITAGTLKSQFSNTFAQADVGKFIRVPSADAIGASSGPSAYWVQITKINDGTGAVAAHSASLAMVSNNATGNFVLTGESRTATLKSYRSGSTFAAFASTDVGRLVRLGFGGRWTWGKITAYTSSSQVTLTLYEDMPRDPRNAANVAGALNGAFTYSGSLVTGSTTGRTNDWRMGAWSDTTGYPAVGAFHEQRLWFANTTTQPQTFWGSVSGDFENMSPTEFDSTVLDDNGITYTLGSTKANAIKWLMSGPAMYIGTSGGEWQVRASSSPNEAITPANIKATEYTGHGSTGSCIPSRVGSSIIFADRSGEKAIEIFYSYENDAVDSDDLTVISEHILREHGGAVAAAFQQKPHSVVWFACTDGTLAGMTVNKKQEVVAWHHHTIQGGTVEDISVIPSEDLSEDELWMVVNRTINGTAKRYIEVLESDFYPASASTRTGMRFPDSHFVISGYTGTVITGLNYLEGQSVVVVKDGTRVAGTSTVASGSITLASSGSEVVIGLIGNADLGSLPPEGGSQFGTSQGKTKRIINLDVRFYNTANLQAGPDSSNLIDHTLTGSPNWFTGTERVLPNCNWDEEATWFIRQPEPYPLNILFVAATLETSE